MGGTNGESEIFIIVHSLEHSADWSAPGGKCAQRAQLLEEGPGNRAGVEQNMPMLIDREQRNLYRSWQ